MIECVRVCVGREGEGYMNNLQPRGVGGCGGKDCKST